MMVETNIYTVHNIVPHAIDQVTTLWIKLQLSFVV